MIRFTCGDKHQKVSKYYSMTKIVVFINMSNLGSFIFETMLQVLLLLAKV